MEHNNNFEFNLILTIQKQLGPVRGRDIRLIIRHESHAGKSTEAHLVPNENDTSQDAWIAIHELARVRLYDTIKIAFVVDHDKKTKEKASVYISHQDLFLACQAEGSQSAIERKFTLSSNDMKAEPLLGDLIVKLASANQVGARPKILYDEVVLTAGETLSVKLSNNNISKEYVGLKNEKGEKLMWVDLKVNKYIIMHNKQEIGFVKQKEKYQVVNVQRIYTFFYHGERICRVKFQQLGEVNSIIEFYNGDSPITLQGDKGKNAHLLEVTAMRANVVIARFTFDKKKKVFFTFYRLTFKNEKDFPLLAFVATILGAQKIG